MKIRAGVLQKESEIGPCAFAENHLLAIVDAFTHPRGPQHIFGHALTPLTTGLRTGQRFTKMPGRLGQDLLLTSCCLEALNELTVLLRSFLLQNRHESSDLLKL